MDAYTVKKFLPRLFIAVILANISLPLIEVLVQFVNALGTSVEAILRQAMPVTVDAVGSNAGFLGAATGVALGAGLAGLAIGGWAAMLPAALSILLALFIVYVIVIVRRILILLLIVLAPIAIAMWAIPGLDKWAGRWFKLLLQLLLVYPIIIALISSGAFVASLIQGSGDDNVNFGQSMAILVAILAPYFLIPTVFKMASSTLANITGAINNRSKGLIDRSKKLRAQRFGENWEKTKQGKRFKYDNPNSIRGRMSRGMQTATFLPKAGIRPSKMRATMGAARTSVDLNSAKEMLEKDEAMQLIKKDDDKLHALVHGRDEAHVREILQASAPGRFDPTRGGSQLALDQATAEVMRVRKEQGTRASRIAGVIAQAGTGTAYNTAGEMLADINEVAGADRTTAGLMLAEMKGASMQAGRVDLGGAGFAHTLRTMDELRLGNLTQAEATESMLNNVYESQGGATIAHSSMKAQAVQQMAPILGNSVHRAMQYGGEDDRMQSLASLAAVYDGMAASSPEKARILADTVMNDQVTTAQLPADVQEQIRVRLAAAQNVQPNQVTMPAQVTISQAINASRGNASFQEMRREYQSETAVPQGGQQQPGGGPPTGAPTQTPGGGAT